MLVVRCTSPTDPVSGVALPFIAYTGYRGTGSARLACEGTQHTTRPWPRLTFIENHFKIQTLKPSIMPDSVTLTTSRQYIINYCRVRGNRDRRRLTQPGASPNNGKRVLAASSAAAIGLVSVNDWKILCGGRESTYTPIDDGVAST
jgi:hypothetical protein